MMLFAFVLASLTFLKIVQPWHIVLLALRMGIANAFDAPARQAFVRELVEPEAITNAIALNSARENSSLYDLKKGLKYTFNHSVIRLSILTVAIMALFGQAYATLLPAWAVKVLHGDAGTNGFLFTARGLGALFRALFIASLGIFDCIGI